ncbi:MAG: energy transducer TonB [Flavobacteriales bacterium]
MEPKKSEKANLDKYGNLFVFLGFLLMSGLAYMLINWRQTTVTENIPPQEIVYEYEEETFEFEEVPEEIPEEIPEEVKVEVPPPEIVKIEQVVDTKKIEKIEAPDVNPEVAPPPPQPAIKPQKGTPAPAPPKPQAADTKKVKDVFDYKKVAQKPIFPGCEGKTGKELDQCNSKVAQKELLRRLEYPEDAIDEERTGTAYVKFIIDEEGQVTDATILRSSKHKDLDRAAIEGVGRMFNGKRKSIIPGKTQSGQEVKVTYQVPVRFRIEQ